MPTLTDPAVIKELLQRHGFFFSRALGQNFIINPGVCPRMAELGGAAPGVGVLEIGPGIGPLTQKFYDTLTGIQWGQLPDTKGWMVEI